MMIMFTGGAGYFGSHTCVELIRHDHAVVIYDNFRNSHSEVLNRIERIADVMPALVTGDVRDQAALADSLAAHGCSAVIHFAGLKTAAESVSQPALYYDNTVVGTLRLLEAMRQANVRKQMFSSSATVYGEPHSLPLPLSHLPFRDRGPIRPADSSGLDLSTLTLSTRPA